MLSVSIETNLASRTSSGSTRQQIRPSAFVHMRSGMRAITDMLQKTDIIHQRLAVQVRTTAIQTQSQSAFTLASGGFPTGSSFSKHGNSLMVCKAFIPFAAGAGKADDISAYKKIKIVRGFFCMDQRQAVAPKCATRRYRKDSCPCIG